MSERTNYPVPVIDDLSLEYVLTRLPEEIANRFDQFISVVMPYLTTQDTILSDALYGAGAGTFSAFILQIITNNTESPMEILGNMFFGGLIPGAVAGIHIGLRKDEEFSKRKKAFKLEVLEMAWQQLNTNQQRELLAGIAATQYEE